MKSMNVFLISAFTLALTACATVDPTATALSQKTVVPGKSITYDDSIEVTATVEHVNKKERILKVRTIDNKIVDFYAPEQVKNFDQIKRGDSIVMNVVESIAFSLADDMSSAYENNNVEVTTAAPQGAKPAIVNTKIQTIRTTIVNIDRTTREVTLQTDDGRRMKVIAGPEVKSFDDLKTGVKVDVKMTSAFALSVRKN